MHSIYITSFNSPDRLRSLVEQIREQGICDKTDRYVMDQSDPEFADEYALICERYNWKHIKNKNHGATASKWSVIQHASSCGYEMFSQISEDFILTNIGQRFSWIPASPNFLEDSIKILNSRRHLSFIHWTFITGGGSVMIDQDGHRASLQLKHVEGSSLAHLEGEIRLLNWPFTARTKRLKCLLDEVMRSGDFKEGLVDGGERLMGERGYGSGGVLFATPVAHKRPAAERPTGSMP